MSEILRFITGLRVRQILTNEESKSLEELLFENRFVLFFPIALQNIFIS